jgi:hypothetical protein
MICETGDPALFPELKIPRSTIRSWLHRDIPDVVTCDSLSAEKTELLAELQELRHRSCRCAGEGPPGANEGEPDGDLWRLCRRS